MGVFCLTFYKKCDIVYANIHPLKPIYMHPLFAFFSICFAGILCQLLKEEKSISLCGPLTKEEYKHISLRLVTKQHTRLSKHRLSQRKTR